MIPLTPLQCQFWTEQQDIVVVDDWLGVDIVLVDIDVVFADIDVVLEYIDIARVGIDLIDIVLAGIDSQSHIEYNHFLLNL